MKPFDKIIIAAFVAVVLLKFTSGPTSPNPNPGPTPGPGVSKVLIEYETAPRPPYTTKQYAALQNAKTGDIQAWMAKNTAEYHNFDPDTDVSKLDKFWQDAVAKAKAKPLPNVSFWNGRRWTASQKIIVDSNSIKNSIGMK